ncbi:HET-domain-containing protein [Apiospora phragmitis]|uniref:HET-domain-containing protein n=1 Tax=Apiospora phragmitis TaxID=2905665 RepID=A0ABR1T353_9PEZI
MGYKVASTAQRMSWAASREATRGEDEAYSLLGIFEINMAPLYGEGAERAFRRLQEEIIRTITNDSILAWLPPEEASGRKADALPTSRATKLVPVNHSADLAKLERRKICILESSAALKGRGRGLKTKSGVLRMWVRFVAEPLHIVEVCPRDVYNRELSVFEASTRASDLLRRRVLVLGDRNHPGVRHVIVAFVQVANEGVQANLITYPTSTARPVDEVVGGAMGANCSELRDAGISKVVHTAQGESLIQVKMQHGRMLGEEIFIVGIERWGR